MTLRKIVKVEEPPKGRGVFESPWDYYVVHYEGQDNPDYLNRAAYKIEMMRRQLIEQGANEELLDEFKSAVWEEATHDYIATLEP